MSFQTIPRPRLLYSRPMESVKKNSECRKQGRCMCKVAHGSWGWGVSMAVDFKHSAKCFLEIKWVNPGSYGESIGIKNCDRLLAINGVNAINIINGLSVENTQDQIDKRNILQTWRLLIVDKICHEYHLKRNLKISENLSYIRRVYPRNKTTLQSLCCKSIVSKHNFEEVLHICKEHQIPNSIRDKILDEFDFVTSLKLSTLNPTFIRSGCPPCPPPPLPSLSTDNKHWTSTPINIGATVRCLSLDDDDNDDSEDDNDAVEDFEDGIDDEDAFNSL